MELAVVLGQVVATVKHEALGNERLLLIDFIDADGAQRGTPAVAADNIGAGNGEWILVVKGSSARKSFDRPETPVDMSVIGIVDEVVVGGELRYHK